ncbi:hypothetical protein [Streptomyces katrae]|uniref:hypothetical protein n=1 Tax=Streptomyces katrae TaxID=68223 RepID=UPI0004BEF96F|nr:hypothetical protein [Streptomyces katrae]
MLEAHVALVVGWLCRRAASSAGRSSDGPLSVPEDVEAALNAVADALMQRLATHSAWDQLQREVTEPGWAGPSERTRQRVASAVEAAAEADPGLAGTIAAVYFRWQAAHRPGKVTASDSGVAVGGNLSVTASGTGAIAVGGSVSGPVTGNTPLGVPKDGASLAPSHSGSEGEPNGHPDSASRSLRAVASGPASIAVGRDFDQQIHHHHYAGAFSRGSLRFDGADALDQDQDWDAMPLELGDALARAVRRQWQEAARQRKLQQEIPVRWRRTRRPVAGQEEAPKDPGRPRLVRAVPYAAAPDDGALREGGIPELLSVYSGVASGRVVVLGGPGAGKSDAALLTVLRALDHRDTLHRGARRARYPVPVLLSIVGWDGHSLEDWLAARLVDDYRIGRKQAEGLIEGGWISLFLDSFDEIAGDLRRAALQEIDRAAYRVVVFSRPGEFEAAVADGHLLGSVALELSPVPASDAVAFLRTMPGLAPWQHLVMHLENEPDSALSQALSTPLTLTLLRDAFPPRHITDLDDLLAERFTSRREVEEYLLGRLVKIRYRPEPSASRAAYGPQQAERWLRYLAGRMNRQHTRDYGRPGGARTYGLNWRRLHHWASPWPRIALTAFVGTLLGASGCVLAYGPGRHVAWEGFRGVGFGAVYGSIAGITFGAGAGALAELRDPAPRWRRRLHAPGSAPRRRFHSPTGVLVAIAVTVMALLDITDPLSWTVSLAGGLVTGALAGFAATQVPAAPGWTGWARWKGLRYWPVLAPASLAGLCRVLTPRQDDGTPNQVLSSWIMAILTMGIVGAVVVAARPVSLLDPVTDPYTSWRQDRNLALVTGAVFGFSISLALGVSQVIGVTSEGAAAGAPDWSTFPFIVIGFGLPFSYACVAAISDHWRTSLLFLQLCLRGDFPLRGMHFLKDAYDHRILRAEGASYQFRHALLQDRLARDQELTPP